MARIVEKIKNTWAAITYPDGVDATYDKNCDDAFDKAIDKFIEICYFFFCIFATISIYFFITREIL